MRLPPVLNLPFSPVLGPGLRICEATGSNIEYLGEEHGHRVLRVRRKGGKVVLMPLPPAVSRAIERSVAERTIGAIWLTTKKSSARAARR